MENYDETKLNCIGCQAPAMPCFPMCGSALHLMCRYGFRIPEHEPLRIPGA